MTDENASRRWRQTRRLMVVALVIWSVLALVMPVLGPAVLGGTLLGFPASYLLTAQGTIVVFVVLALWFSGRQDAIDRDFGAAEDDF